MTTSNVRCRSSVSSWASHEQPLAWYAHAHPARGAHGLLTSVAAGTVAPVAALLRAVQRG